MLGLAVASVESVGLGCSGPGAAEAIRVSGLIALGSLALTVLSFLCALLVPPVRRLIGWRGVVALLAASVFHPGLWLSTLSGDCGFTARWASIGFMPVLAGLIAVLIHRHRQRARRPNAQAAGPSTN